MYNLCCWHFVLSGNEIISSLRSLSGSWDRSTMGTGGSGGECGGWLDEEDWLPLGWCETTPGNYWKHLLTQYHITCLTIYSSTKHTPCARCSTEHCQWNAFYTADVSSTLQLVTGTLSALKISSVVGVTTQISEHVHVCTQGFRNPEEAHKHKQRNMSSARPGVNWQSTITFTMSRSKRKAS